MYHIKYVTSRGMVSIERRVVMNVTSVMNYILGRGTLANEAAADVNGDSNVDIADVAALIELIK